MLANIQRTMLIKAAAIVVLSGSILAVLFGSPGMTHLLPAGSAVRDMLPRLVLHTQGWFQDLFGGGRSERPSSRMPEQNQGEADANGRTRIAVGRYRTLCVRLCDGFYWPMSHSTIRARFSRDAKQCETACPGRSQLFVQRAGSEDVDNMVDLKSVPYTQFKNALRYRTEYVKDCTCRGNPWDAEAIARHRAYAEAAKRASEKAGVDNKKQSDLTKRRSPMGSWAQADIEARN